MEVELEALEALLVQMEAMLQLILEVAEAEVEAMLV